MSFAYVCTASPRRLSAWAVVSLALAASSLHAAPPKPREGTLGGGKGGGPIMSMAQLRSCVAQQSRIDTQNGEMVKQQQELASERAEIDRSAAALKEGMAALDRTNKEAVESYVARAQAHDKTIEAYEARVPTFNAKVEALQAERATYAKACEGRRYLEDDYKDIKAGK
jgi:hypothetical protein